MRLDVTAPLLRVKAKRCQGSLLGEQLYFVYDLIAAIIPRKINDMIIIWCNTCKKSKIANNVIKNKSTLQLSCERCALIK